MSVRFVGVTVLVCVLVGCSQSAPSGGQLPVAPPASSPPPAATASKQVPPPPGSNVVPPAQSKATPPPAGQAQQVPPPSGETQPATSVQNLLSQATAAAQTRNFAGAIQSLEQALSQEPTNRQALGMLTEITQVYGMQLAQGGNEAEAYPMFVKSGQYFRKLREAHKDLSERENRLASHVLYNEACGYAKGNQPAKAIASLNDAFEAGFDDLALLDKDTDLDPLRELPEYQKLREGASERILARAREHAKKLIAEHTPFDFSFSLPNLDGKTVSLADFKGKVLIVDVWGTWCPPCRMEIPHFVELHKKYREAGLEIVGLNYERVPAEQVNDTIKTFVSENGVSYACLIGDRATQEMIPEFNAFPTTLFLDRAGKVRLKVVGYHPLPKLEAIVTTLLSETGSAPAAN